jgi:hypothetical protein
MLRELASTLLCCCSFDSDIGIVLCLPTLCSLSSKARGMVQRPRPVDAISWMASTSDRLLHGVGVVRDVDRLRGGTLL